MCRLAIADNPVFDASAIEIERAGDTYTVDTLRAMRAHYPDNVELFFITGSDALLSILNWYKNDEIARLAHLIGAARPGSDLSEKQRRFLREHSELQISYAEVTALDISSSDIRERVASGKSIRYLVPDSVRRYIEEHGLYREAERAG